MAFYPSFSPLLATLGGWPTGGEEKRGRKKDLGALPPTRSSGMPDNRGGEEEETSIELRISTPMPIVRV